LAGAAGSEPSAASPGRGPKMPLATSTNTHAVLKASRTRISIPRKNFPPAMLEITMTAIWPVYDRRASGFIANSFERTCEMPSISASQPDMHAGHQLQVAGRLSARAGEIRCEVVALPPYEAKVRSRFALELIAKPHAGFRVRQSRTQAALAIVLAIEGHFEFCLQHHPLSH